MKISTWGIGRLVSDRATRARRAAALVAMVPLVLGAGYTLGQFLFPAASISATTVSGAEVGLTIKDFIKLAVDTNNLVLVDSSGNTIISPSSTGTMITGNVNVAVTTNTAQGYSLSVYTEDNSTSMVHSNSTVTDEISSIDTVSGYNAETGAQDLSANTWGFRNRTTSGLSNWFAVGENESNGTVIANTNTGNSLYCEALSYPLENTGCDAGSYDTHSVNFGAKVTDTIAAGTYTNNVVFSAVAKSEGTRYTLKFNPNGGNNTMGPRTVVKGSTITLPRTGFVKAGYAIKGWALTQADAEAKTENPSATTTNPTYSAGQTLEVTNLLLAATEAGQAVEQNALINLYAIWEEDVLKCSDTVHPTASTACQMADGRMWILGNSGNSTTFNDICTNQTGTDNHNATCSSCPSGYNFPKITDYDTLIQAYGGTSYSGSRSGYQETTGALYKVLGLSSVRSYWSSTERTSSNAYNLDVYARDSYSVNNNYKTGNRYVLCYKWASAHFPPGVAS